MSDTRPAFCPACGRKLRIPAAAPAGRLARCGVCSTTFPIPPPVDAALVRPEPAAAPPQEPRRTGAQLFDLSKLPPELRAALAEGGAPEAPRAKPSPAPPAPAPRTPDELEALSQKAFDLDAGQRPVRRTGVAVVNLKELGLLLDDEDR